MSLSCWKKLSNIATLSWLIKYYNDRLVMMIMIWLTKLPSLIEADRVTHICISKLDNHWFRYWLVAWSAPTHHLNQCWFIVNWKLTNKFQWNFNRNLNIFTEENAFGNVVWKMAAILSRPQCDNGVAALDLLRMAADNLWSQHIAQT